MYVIDSLTQGGAETSLAAMAPGLVGRGVALDVVALTSRPGYQDALERAGATVIELSGSRLTWWRQIRTLARERRPDLVHTTLFEADLAGRVGARLARTPVVSTLANDAYGAAHRAEFPHRRAKLLAAQASDAVTARLTTRLHAVSGHVADTMAHRLRYPRDRIHVIPRGRDPEALGWRAPERRDRARGQLGIAPGTPLVIALARQERQKGLDVLIDAVPHVLDDIPSARFVVAGKQGNATASLERQMAAIDRGDALTFLGVRDDVADLLCAADLFVLPSRREGLGGALLEAMALECPAVVSDIPPVREVVDDSSAVFVPPNDPVALGTALVHALSDPAGAQTMAVAAHRRFLDEYTIGSVVDRMLAFYNEAASGS